MSREHPHIAIVGMSCRYPDAKNPGELWENVLAQRRAFRRMPAERMSIDDYWAADRAAPDRTYSREAAVIEGYEFDRVRFKVSGSQFRSSDLAHWLALDMAAEALADAGFEDGQSLPREKAGVLLANTLTGDISRANVLRLRWPYVRRMVGASLRESGMPAEQVDAMLARMEETYKAPFPGIDEESLAGGLSNTIAGRICNHFDLKGGGYTVDGACASSLLAVSNACNAVATRDLDVAIAGGVDLSLDPFELVGFAKAGALATDDMRVYDVRSAGFWPGEGCGFVVLMRLEDAVAQGRQVYAVIRGWGISSDGAGGITRPEPDGQLLAVRRAYERAGVDIGSIAYFEGHGTGTNVGDTTELSVLSTARRESATNGQAAIGSIKANIGHTKAAAGLAGLIKAALAVHHRVIPPTTGCNEPHSLLSGADAALRVPVAPESWDSQTPMRAGVSSMGFGGINAHVVLESGPAKPRATRASVNRSSRQDAELFLFSGNDAKELAQKIKKVLDYAERLSRSEMVDLSAAIAKTDEPANVRAAVVASTPAQLAERLSTLADWLKEGRTAELDVHSGIFLGSGSAQARLGLLFPGQGCPAQRNGGHWRNRFEEVASLYDEAALPMNGDEVRTDVAQPAIVTASLAALRMLRALGIEASGAVGHSLGELTALYWAGATDEAGIRRIATARGQAMQELSRPAGTMAAITASPEEVATILVNEPVIIASHNTPNLTVVSGDVRAVEAVGRRAMENGWQAKKLRVSHAFHSPLVASAAPRIAQHVAAVGLAPLKRDVYSTVTGAVLRPSDDLSDLLVKQVTSPVLFVEAVREAAEKVDWFIEAGPGRVLGGLAAEITSKPIISLDACSDSVAGLLRAVGAAFAMGMPVKPGMLFENRFHRPFDLDWKPVFIANPCEAAPQDHAGASTWRPAAKTEGAPGAAANRKPFDVVRELVARRVELPLESVHAESRLLGDLHLNSIVVGQLAVEASRQLGLPAPVNPTDYASATVGTMAKALEDLLANGGAAVPDSHRVPAGVDTWIRPWVVEWIERPSSVLDSRRKKDRAPSDGWRVVAHQACPLAERLRTALVSCEGGGVVVCLPPAYVEMGTSLLLEGVKAMQAHRGRGRFIIVEDRNDVLPGRFGGAAMARTLHLESPETDVRVVHVPADDPRAVQWVLDEARSIGGFSEARYDGDGRRWEPVMHPVSLTRASHRSMGPQDVLLVTGGGKGIACECALAVARETGVRVALLGRANPREDASLAANLERFRAAGARFAYYPADVTDGAAIRAAVERIEHEMGLVTGFLHGAGANTPQLLSTLDLAAFKRTLAPKLDGARNVLAAIDPDRLRLFVTFGSIIARAGLRGEGDYAVANDWMAELTEQWQAHHPNCRCLAIEWSVWSGVGMGERLGRIETLAQQGITAIPPDQGVRIFNELLASERTATRIVVTGRFGELPTIKMDGQPLPFLRFLESPRVQYPGVELVVDAKVSFQSDPYLADHVFHGEPLLPAVVGLEAMVQSAMAVTGRTDLPILEDIELTRPISVWRDKEVTVRLAALVRSPERVEVVLRCDQTGFGVDHFRAICRFGSSPREENLDAAALGAPLSAGRLADLSPEGDLYGSLLFHDGRFRRIEGYRSLRARSCLAELAPPETDEFYGSFMPKESRLGDATLRDAAIHCIQACIPQSTILPMGVERIEIVDAHASGARLVWARERAHSGDVFTYDLDVLTPEGRVIERWRGLKLKAVAASKMPESLSSALLSPYLERQMKSVSVAVHNNGLGDRREWSTRAMQDALGANVAVSRRSDGKPESANGRSVSASHSGDLTLGVAGDGAIACDVESVIAKDDQTWNGLLGDERFSLAGHIAHETGESFDSAATRVWCAAECLKKAGAAANGPLTMTSRENGRVTLKSGSLATSTVRVSVRGREQPLVFAVLAEGADAVV